MPVMRKHFHKILFVSTIAVMTIILVQTVTGIVKLKPLHGAVTETENPKLTLQSYVDGTYQDSLENYCRNHSGFREWLIRAYNQYLWSCFKETSNATVVCGKDGWLFEETHVRDYYESLMYKYADDNDKMRKIFETEVQRFKKVQELLEEHNIHLFLVIAPCKDAIYPEYLPKNATYLRPDGLHAYDYYKKRFDETGVNYIDFVSVFRNVKDSVDYPLFPSCGTHWSNIASVYAFDSILRYMEVLGNQNLINLDVGERYQAETRDPDNDLEIILNLAFPIKSRPNIYADVGIREDSTAVKPNFLIVGDSYYFNIAGSTPIWEIFQKYIYWYYNSTIYGDDEHTSTLEVDYEQELMRPDYIMLIYNPVTLYEFSSYFLPRALLHLCYDQTVIDSAAHKMMKEIKFYGYPDYPEFLKVAQKSNRSIDEVLYDNVIYMFRTDPEHFFGELSDDQLPVSRNKDLARIRKNAIFARSKSLKE